MLCGESNYSETSQFLKFGTTALIVALIEHGMKPNVVNMVFSRIENNKHKTEAMPILKGNPHEEKEKAKKTPKGLTNRKAKKTLGKKILSESPKDLEMIEPLPDTPSEIVIAKGQETLF